jgi:hypothetical protein
MTMHTLYDYAMAKFDIAKFEKIKEAKTKSLSEILSEVEKQKANEKVLADLKARETENEQKQGLLDLLSESDIAKMTAYSSYFEALAKRKVNDLWIRKITIKNDGAYLLLEGSCVRATAIMEFIDALKNEPTFFGKVFQLFTVSQDAETNALSFILETKNQATKNQVNS